jgi:uncharacterized protein YqjF (DUF2071 family)
MTEAAAPPPVIGRPVMRQRWLDLASLHWPVDPGEVRVALPPGLDVDEWDGAAWVGLIPFRMRGIAPHNGPSPPWLGSFLETNVRTYVVGRHGPGVWFHSLDVDRLAPVPAARLGFGLPYAWSAMRAETRGLGREYRARRRWPAPAGAASRVAIEVGERLAKVTPLQNFVTARWRLYSVRRGRLLHAPVAHPPWPLHAASLVDLDDELVAAAGYRVEGPPAEVLWSPGVPVVVGRLEAV